MANEALYYGTGRRKNAVARVRLVPGTGKVTVNGRDGKEYFGREALLDYAKTPFKVTDTQDHFDVLARIDGGGISGQAGALRHGISRALLAAGDYRWLPDARRSYGRAQEVRSEEGPQAPAVQQALRFVSFGCATRGRASLESPFRESGAGFPRCWGAKAAGAFPTLP